MSFLARILFYYFEPTFKCEIIVELLLKFHEICYMVRFCFIKFKSELQYLHILIFYDVFLTISLLCSIFIVISLNET